MQKRNLIHKLNTKILCILILFVLIYITANFTPQTLNVLDVQPNTVVVQVQSKN